MCYKDGMGTLTAIYLFSLIDPVHELMKWAYSERDSSSIVWSLMESRKTRQNKECLKNRPQLTEVCAFGAPGKPLNFPGYPGDIWPREAVLVTKDKFHLIDWLLHSFTKTYWLCLVLFGAGITMGSKNRHGPWFSESIVLNITKSSKDFAQVLKSWNSALAIWFFYVSAHWFWLFQVLLSYIIHSVCWPSD